MTTHEQTVGINFQTSQMKCKSKKRHNRGAYLCMSRHTTQKLDALNLSTSKLQIDLQSTI